MEPLKEASIYESLKYKDEFFGTFIIRNYKFTIY